MYIYNAKLLSEPTDGQEEKQQNVKKRIRGALTVDQP